MVDEDGFEPSKAELTDLQSAPFGHSGTSPMFVTIKNQIMSIVIQYILCSEEFKLDFLSQKNDKIFYICTLYECDKGRILNIFFF